MPPPWGGQLRYRVIVPDPRRTGIFLRGLHNRWSPGNPTAESMMATYYNQLGGAIVGGTAERDIFYAFTKDPNQDHLRADAVVTLLTWDTGILTGSGSFYQIVAPNV